MNYHTSQTNAGSLVKGDRYVSAGTMFTVTRHPARWAISDGRVITIMVSVPTDRGEQQHGVNRPLARVVGARSAGHIS